jgi:hypothetical protein
MGKRLRSEHPPSERARFITFAVVTGVGLLLALHGIIPIWANVPLSLIQAAFSGAIGAKVLTPDFASRIDQFTRRNKPT